SDDRLPRVVKYIGGIIRQMDGQLLEGDGMDDHLHLAAILHPTSAIADALRTLKTNSTRWIHQTFDGMAAFAWQEGYAAFTVSRSVLPAVKEYIRTQKEHHRKMTFADELKALLDKHGIEYDERYLV
ncbi:MAG: IS200/IS605 family transposase, partial [Planctomycetota bacterium]